MARLKRHLEGTSLASLRLFTIKPDDCSRSSGYAAAHGSPAGPLGRAHRRASQEHRLRPRRRPGPRPSHRASRLGPQQPRPLGRQQALGAARFRAARPAADLTRESGPCPGAPVPSRAGLPRRASAAHAAAAARHPHRLGREPEPVGELDPGDDDDENEGGGADHHPPGHVRRCRGGGAGPGRRLGAATAPPAAADAASEDSGEVTPERLFFQFM